GKEMQTKRNLIVALVAIVALSAGVAVAQTTTYEVRQGKVLYVDGNTLYVQADDGTVREFDVPSDFRFDIDGQKVPVGALKPGTMLTQTIATTTTPNVVKSTEIRKAEIVQRVGQTVIYRDENGRINRITGVPEGWIVFRDGEPVPIEALAGGDRVTAVIVHKTIEDVTDQDIKVAGTAPKAPAAPSAAPAPAPRPAPAPAPAPMLPKTGSQLPLIGLTGLLALALGLGLAALRRI
ncbi:MAG: hypothetical protein PVG53_14640, partial [Holophagae bacterium]